MSCVPMNDGEPFTLFEYAREVLLAQLLTSPLGGIGAEHHGGRA